MWSSAYQTRLSEAEQRQFGALLDAGVDFPSAGVDFPRR